MIFDFGSYNLESFSSNFNFCILYIFGPCYVRFFFLLFSHSVYEIAMKYWWQYIMKLFCLISYLFLSHVCLLNCQYSWWHYLCCSCCLWFCHYACIPVCHWKCHTSFLDFRWKSDIVFSWTCNMYMLMQICLMLLYILYSLDHTDIFSFSGVMCTFCVLCKWTILSVVI